jgi:hypothetical protein
MEFEDD